MDSTQRPAARTPLLGHSRALHSSDAMALPPPCWHCWGGKRGLCSRPTPCWGVCPQHPRVMYACALV